MPTLFFADPETLRLVLTSGVVPLPVSRSPAQAGFDTEGRLWLQPHAPLHRDALAGLARLGVQVLGSSSATRSFPVDCWQQLLPVQKAPIPQPFEGEVIFEVATSLLPELMAELRRQRRPRFALRWPDEWSGRALVRVQNPPLYTLARAELPCSDDDWAVRAYYEQAPHVWVQVGYRQSLADQIQPPDGQILLLRPPRSWTLLDDGPYTADLVDFPLHQVPRQRLDRSIRPRLPVELRLVPGGAVETAELWVVRDRPAEQLADLLRNADDRLLSRLRFAWRSGPDHPLLVLQSQTSRLPPPVLTLRAEAYQSYLKLPNLFVPVGHRLSPPPRRDVVRKLLADDLTQIVWLHGLDQGRFRPESLPDETFLPLAPRVEYRAEAIKRWQPRRIAVPFEMPAFLVLPDEDAPKPVNKNRSTEATPPKPGLLDKLTGLLRWEVSPRLARSPRPSREQGPSLEDQLRTFLRRPETPGEPPNDPVKKNDWHERRQRLEARLLESGGRLPDAERQALWPELAALLAALNNPGDAAICWLNALWESDELSPLWAWGWLRAECQVSRWNPTQAVLSWLTDHEASPALVRTLAAYVLWSALQDPPPTQIVARMDAILARLNHHEEWLPVRAAWLVQLAAARLTQGDSLGLVRARDRLMTRLFHQGLSMDRDLPGFLRFAGGAGGGDRFQVVRDWLIRFHDPLQRWIARLNGSSSLQGLQRQGLEPESGRWTRAYVDFTLAWGLARLGERQESEHLVRQSSEWLLARPDSVHSVLVEAYRYRIGQALEGKVGQGPLPTTLLDRLPSLRPAERYVVDRWRSESRILEPSEQINPYLWVHAASPGANDWNYRLASTALLVDAEERSASFRHLLTTAEMGIPLVNTLRVALDLAPGLDESFTQAVLARLREAPSGLPRSQRLALVQRAVFAAAHHGLHAPCRSLMESLPGILPDRPNLAALTAVEELARRCFPSLRRLGLRDELDTLLKRIADWVLQGRTLSDLRTRPSGVALASLRVLLHVAASWLAHGQELQADAVLDESRQVLFAGKLSREDQKDLALAYVTALGQLAVRKALGRIEEIFQRMPVPPDRSILNSYLALSPLLLVETVVLAVVQNDFTLGASVRRWLTDDELLVRQRIHRDVKAFLGRDGAAAPMV